MGPLALLLAGIVGCSAACRTMAQDSVKGTCKGEGANPFVYNFMVNGRPAKVINDAPADAAIPVSAGFWSPIELAARALREGFLNDTAITFSNNVLYIAGEDGGVLFDTGSGPQDLLGIGAGTLLEQLEAEGIARESIKHILITHAHSDHVGGLVEDFEAESLAPVFPEATVYISKRERDIWFAEAVDFGDALFNEEQQEALLKIARAALTTVAPKTKTFEFDEEVIPGVTAIHTPHHTPGSVAFVIKNGDSRIVYAGDAVSHKVLSIENPFLRLLSDVDATAAPTGRYSLLDKVVEEKWTLISPHADFPALMNLKPESMTYQVIQLLWKGNADAMTVCTM